jgi:hypothetical protein
MREEEHVLEALFLELRRQARSSEQSLTVVPNSDATVVVHGQLNLKDLMFVAIASLGP